MAAEGSRRSRYFNNEIPAAGAAVKRMHLKARERTSQRGDQHGCQLNLLHLSQSPSPKRHRRRHQTIKRRTRKQQRGRKEPRTTPRKKTTLKNGDTKTNETLTLLQGFAGTLRGPAPPLIRYQQLKHLMKRNPSPSNTVSALSSISIIQSPYLHAVLLTERNIFINYFINAGFFSMNLIMEHLHLGNLGKELYGEKNHCLKEFVILLVCMVPGKNMWW